MHVREDAPHQREAEATFLAGAGVGLCGGLFLRDADAVVTDGEADEAGPDLRAAPKWAERFVQSVGVLDDVGEHFVAADEELKQGVVRDAGKAAPFLEEVAGLADALGGAEGGELVRRWWCSVF